MGEPGISCMEPFLKKKKALFFPGLLWSLFTWYRCLLQLESTFSFPGGGQVL